MLTNKNAGGDSGYLPDSTHPSLLFPAYPQILVSASPLSPERATSRLVSSAYFPADQLLLYEYPKRAHLDPSASEIGQFSLNRRISPLLVACGRENATSKGRSNRLPPSSTFFFSSLSSRVSCLGAPCLWKARPHCVLLLAPSWASATESFPDLAQHPFGQLFPILSALPSASITFVDLPTGRAARNRPAGQSQKKLSLSGCMHHLEGTRAGTGTLMVAVPVLPRSPSRSPICSSASPLRQPITTPLGRWNSSAREICEINLRNQPSKSGRQGPSKSPIQLDVAKVAIAQSPSIRSGLSILPFLFGRYG